MDIQNLFQQIDEIDRFKRYGKIHKVVGLTVESIGPESSIGDLCYIHTKNGDKIPAEVVGFKGENIILMPFTSIKQVAPGSIVEATQKPLTIKVGMNIVGQVVDAMGNPLDGGQLPKGLTNVKSENEPPNPLTKPPIEHVMEVGVKSIDGLLTIGNGQRVGIFAGSGVGKSTLLGMIAKQAKADINVIALIGERGREVREFINRDLGEQGLKKSVVVAATSDQPALMRIKAAYTATAIAEYFRDKGLNVMLMMDSVTRVAMAQREVGLAVGEPPTTKGYPPSVFALLPKLLERTGTNQNGSITAFYTVLVDGDDLNEPISDTVRGILDGHIVLDRELANKGQYPAINILKSVSRIMNSIVTDEHKRGANELRSILSTYLEAEDLINIGAYKRGSSAEIDRAIRIYPNIISFLKQSIDESQSFETTVQQLLELIQKG
ncbi:flagellar protein export ATPase FliI [Bacillus kexueae]|uniref:flagellar protein export ATPase FliI n=1 Tax=Aeribacillus kexueae TaxID=2078952 RepID=UPI001FAFC214|nr:flagellar protein export ATPase FliI [Bacillus kexueae]